jgi:hypothetical protein
VVNSIRSIAKVSDLLGSYEVKSRNGQSWRWTFMVQGSDTAFQNLAVVNIDMQAPLCKLLGTAW